MGHLVHEQRWPTHWTRDVTKESIIVLQRWSSVSVRKQAFERDTVALVVVERTIVYVPLLRGRNSIHAPVVALIFATYGVA